MDQPTRQQIEERIKQLEQRRAQLFAQMTATSGAIAELQRLLQQKSDDEPEQGAGEQEQQSD